MLKIIDNADLKELEKFGIYPEYICNTRTGETKIVAYTLDERMTFNRLKFKKKTKRIANIKPKSLYIEPVEYELVLSEEPDERIDLDKLYGLIKAGLIEKI